MPSWLSVPVSNLTGDVLSCAPTRSAAEFPLFYNAIMNGYQIVYRPDAIVYHSHHEEYQGFRQQFYGYGVGFTAFLTKCLLDDPRLVAGALARLDAHEQASLHTALQVIRRVTDYRIADRAGEFIEAKFKDEQGGFRTTATAESSALARRKMPARRATVCCSSRERAA